MSRSYHMHFKISGFDPTRRSLIEDVLGEEWEVEVAPDSQSWLPENTIMADGESRLCGGESEEEFTDRIARRVWTVNGGFCLVEVVATCLDNIPCETHTRDIEAFDKALADNPNLLTAED